MGNKLFLLAILLIVIVSCSNKGGELSDKSKIYEEKTIKYAIIETDKGIIKAELYIDKAPITSKNFIDLANAGFYNGLTFHRVEPDFVIQGGDPKGDGTGGSARKIPLEINPDLKHVKWALAMARTNDPNSASSQFYITLAETHFLDGNYAVFGKVIKGMNVVSKISVGDKMDKVYISDK
ncbi:peptidylprolyl isomerase [Candidatus Woesearchaeota archaeon]|nr:peptidylprolyl isomerase [Candidatus Woesearchaeota archaeon]